MKLGIVGFVALVMTWSAAATGTTFYTPVLDGYAHAYPADSYWEEQAIPRTYELATTWDADFLWVALNSEVGRRFLCDGDTCLSFFVAIDVDQTFGSGAPTDGYGNVNFYGCYMPEYIYYFAGGAGWYEWGYWDGAAWDWRGWRSDNTYYGWPGEGAVDDELGILWQDLGFPAGIAVMTWITDDPCFSCDPGYDGVLAAWPIENPTGSCPTFMWAYPFFAPHVPGPMPVEGFAPNSVTATSGEYTANDPTCWGGIKALYR